MREGEERHKEVKRRLEERERERDEKGEEEV